MGLELAKAYIRVQVDGTDVNSGFNGIRAVADKHLAGIRKSALAITGIFSGGMAAILRSGLQSAGEFEQTTIAFETLLGSAKEAQSTLNDLTTFAAKTPFEMPEITQAARGLIQFGERGQELMGTLHTLGNAASGTSVPFGFLALVFNQVRGVGKLLTQDFRQLSTRGIISLEDISKHFGVTRQEADKMLSSGRVKFTDLKKILEDLSKEGGRFHNLMERQSTSLLGLYSTLNDSYRIMFRILAQSLMPVVKAFTAATIGAVSTIQSLVQMTGGMAGSMLAGATAAATLTAGIFGLIQALQFFQVTWTELMVGSGIGILMIGLGLAVGFLVDHFNLMDGIGSKVTAAFAVIEGAIQDLMDWSEILFRHWKGIWEAMPDLVLFAMNYTGDIIRNAGPLIGQTIGYWFGQSISKLTQWSLSFINIVAKTMQGVTAIIRAMVFGGGIEAIKKSLVDSIMGIEGGFNKGKKGKKPKWSTLFDMSPETADLFLKSDKLKNLWTTLNAEAQLLQMKRNKAKGDLPPAAFTPDKPLIEFGRYQLTELGNKMQDALLKKGGDKGLELQQHQVDLAQAGLTKQDELIAAVKDNAGGGAATLTNGPD